LTAIIVTSFSRLSGDAQNGLIYSYQSGHNFALMNDDLFFLLKNLRGRSGGKGMTDVQARASAVCEAIERYSGVFRGEEISRRASYRELVEARAPILVESEKRRMLSTGELPSDLLAEIRSRGCEVTPDVQYELE
jgi:ribosomal protein S12 methylthiotransferase accessory factor YcaO